MRYTDPTGHICVQNGGGMDDEFGIAGNCNGGEKANYKNPFPGGVPAVNKPGKPKKDDGGAKDIPELSKDDDAAQTPTLDTTSTSESPEDEEASCPSCVVTGGLIIVAMLPIEFALGLGMVLVAPTVPVSPGLGLTLELVLLLPEAAALNVTLIGIQYVVQGQDRSREDIEIDPLPLVHLFFPDFMKPEE